MFAPWRTYQVFRAVCRSESMGEVTKWSGEARGRVFQNALLVVCDLLTCLPLALVVGSVYRVYPLLRDMCAEPLADNDEGYSYNHRKMVWEQAALLFFDLLFAVFVLPVVLTVYRMPTACEEMRAADSGFRKRAVFIWQFALIVVDLPFLVLGLLSLVWVWRIPGFAVQLLARCEDAAERRLAAGKNLVYGAKDLLFSFVGAAVVAGTLYRLPFFVMDLVGACKSPKRNDARSARRGKARGS